jgi:hypothetical protein
MRGLSQFLLSRFDPINYPINSGILQNAEHSYMKIIKYLLIVYMVFSVPSWCFGQAVSSSIEEKSDEIKERERIIKHRLASGNEAFRLKDWWYALQHYEAIVSFLPDDKKDLVQKRIIYCKNKIAEQASEEQQTEQERIVEQGAQEKQLDQGQAATGVNALQGEEIDPERAASYQITYLECRAEERELDKEELARYIQLMKGRNVGEKEARQQLKKLQHDRRVEEGNRSWEGTILKISDVAMPIINILKFVLLAVIAIFIYFVPSIIAKQKNHINMQAIFVLNVFAGWTFVGWVVAMVWAFMRQGNAKPQG